MCWEPIVWATAEPTPFFNRVYGNAGRDFLVVNETKGDPFRSWAGVGGHHGNPVRWRREGSGGSGGHVHIRR
jgi:hypothetical protein